MASPTKRVKIKNVGITGFEPATPRSQSECATKLRHIPILNIPRRRHLQAHAHTRTLRPLLYCLQTEKYKTAAPPVIATMRNEKRTAENLEGMTGIEPASSAWKAEVLATIRHSHCELACEVYKKSATQIYSASGIPLRPVMLHHTPHCPAKSFENMAFNLHCCGGMQV